MDLVSIALLGMFGAALAGGLTGWLVGRFTRFEVGLATGLLIFGGVTFWFAGRCYVEYRDFAYAGANGLWGEVIRIEEIPVGDSASQTAPVVRFSAPDDSVHTVLGPRASSARVGEHVNVIYDAADPQRSRIGQITELRGCAIAMMLFGTFPLSFALFMLYSTFAHAAGGAWTRPPSGRAPLAADAARRQRDATRREPSHSSDGAAAASGRARSKIVVAISMALFLTMFGAIVWIGMGPGDLSPARFSQGFGVVAGALVGYALLGLFGQDANSIWAFGVVMLALNFAVWAWALHLLA